MGLVNTEVFVTCRPELKYLDNAINLLGLRVSLEKWKVILKIPWFWSYTKFENSFDFLVGIEELFFFKSIVHGIDTDESTLPIGSRIWRSIDASDIGIGIIISDQPD